MRFLRWYASSLSLCAACAAFWSGCAGAKHKPPEPAERWVCNDYGSGSGEDPPKDKPGMMEYANMAHSQLSITRNYYQAIHSATEAIQLAPNNALGYALRAEAHRIDENYYQAIEDATTALRLDPYGYNAAAMYVVRATSRNDKDMSDDDAVDLIIADCDSALLLNPRDEIKEKAYFIRALAYGRKGNYDQALEDVDTAIQMTPGGSGRYYVRAAARLEKKDYDGAIEDAAAEIRLYPDGFNAGQARGLLARVYSEKGDYERAVDALTAAIHAQPGHAGLYNSRAWTYAHYMKKHFDCALEDANMSIELDPNRAASYDTRGWAYFGLGDYDSAEKDFAKALQLNPNLEETKESLEKVREARAGKR